MNEHTATTIENNRPDFMNNTYPIIRTVAQFRAYLDDSYQSTDQPKFTNEEFNHILNYLFDANLVEHKAKKPTSVAFIKALNPDQATLENVVMTALDLELDALIAEATEIAEGPHPENPTEPTITEKILAETSDSGSSAMTKKTKAQNARADSELDPTDDVNGLSCKDRKAFRTKARAWCRKHSYSWEVVNGIYIVDRTPTSDPTCYLFFDEDANLIEWTSDRSEAPEIIKATKKNTNKNTTASTDETLSDVDALLADS